MTNTQLRVLRNNRGSLFVLALFILITTSAMVAAALQTGTPRSPAASGIPPTSTAVLCSVEDSFSSIAQRIEPGVVSITSVQRVTSDTVPGRNDGVKDLNEFLRKLFKGSLHQPLNAQQFNWHTAASSQDESVTAEGSGTIVRRQGDKFFVLTNYHVVEDSYRVAVRLADETDLRGTVVGIDPVTDLAVVQISSPSLSDKNVVPLGDSNTVKVGAWALAVGSPFGFEHTLTIGIISAVQRQLNDEETDYPDLIQTDAAINKGNSGGPLLDVEGRMIGINAAIASPTGGSIGLGFAIPVNTAKAILDDLIQQGRVVRGWLGAGIQELNPVLEQYYGVKQGVLVASVDPKSPAAKAGLASEDIIVAANGSVITEVKQLQRLIGTTPPETPVSMTIMRNGARQTVNVQIGLSPSTPKGRPSPPAPTQGAGIKVRTLTGDLADRLGVEGTKGVLVIDVTPGGPAETAGLEEGDVIVSMGHQPTTNDKDFTSMLANVQTGGIVVLKVVRKGAARFIGFTME